MHRLPPVIGWSAVTNSLDPAAAVLFAVMYLWQVPHFLAIALDPYRDESPSTGSCADIARAGAPFGDRTSVTMIHYRPGTAPGEPDSRRSGVGRRGLFPGRPTVRARFVLCAIGAVAALGVGRLGSTRCSARIAGLSAGSPGSRPRRRGAPILGRTAVKSARRSSNLFSHKEPALQLGMIGLGRMGANMVRRLLKAGHQCVVFDRSPA